jgi:hypothetical protein
MQFAVSYAINADGFTIHWSHYSLWSHDAAYNSWSNTLMRLLQYHYKCQYWCCWWAESIHTKSIWYRWNTLIQHADSNWLESSSGGYGHATILNKEGGSDVHDWQQLPSQQQSWTQRVALQHLMTLCLVCCAGNASLLTALARTTQKTLDLE